MSTYLQEILADFELPQPRDYTPAFRVCAEDGAWLVHDGERPIARFYPLHVDIWAFSPFEPDIKFNVEPAGKVVDLHTLHNTTINLGAHGWPANWARSVSNIEAALEWRWEMEEGDALAADIRFKGPEGEWGHWRWHLRYDAVWGRYRLTCEIHARKMDPAGFEPFNMMTAGALGCRAEDRRWSHSLWESMDNQLRRIVHSNVLFSCTDYGGFRDGGGPWRRRYSAYPRGWIGYAAHDVFNPVTLVHHTNTPIYFATCSQLFDEHLVWSNGGQDILEEDGYFHFRMDVEVVNLRAALARELLAQATDPVKPARWHQQATALAFHMDVVNDFEEPVDPWVAEDCPFFMVGPTDARIAWGDDQSHSGTHAIRMTAEKPHERVELFPVGAVCRVDLHTRYRFSAWVKTEAAFRFARLELDGIEYTFHNKIMSATSAPLSGTSEWTKLEVELDSGDQPYLLPRLVLYGAGRAWFDDAMLEKA